jgi:hypothetical protein
LTLGDLGAQWLPQLAGGLLPLALWLGAIGVVLALAGRAPPSTGQLRAVLLMLSPITGLLALAANHGERVALPGLALAWAVLLVAASHTVRRLRRALPPGQAHVATPVLPACIGGLLAWSIQTGAGSAGSAVTSIGVAGAAALPVDAAGAPGAAVIAVALGLLGLVLAALVPSGPSHSGACRAGLFDCSLPWVGGAHGGSGTSGGATGWPLMAAGVLMLPMMASLPAMAPWCGPGLSGSALTALHLGAMLLPGLALCLVAFQVPGHPPAPPVQNGLSGWLAWHTPVGLGRWVAALMLLGLLLWWWLADGAGLLALVLCHGAAWSLAWAGPMLAPSAGTPGSGIGTTMAPQRRHDHASLAGTTTGAERLRTMAQTQGALLEHAPMQQGHGESTRCRSASTLASWQTWQTWLSPTLAPLLLLVFGAAVARWGVVALVATHLALTLWALAGVVVSAAGSTRLGVSAAPDHAAPDSSAKPLSPGPARL